MPTTVADGPAVSTSELVLRAQRGDLGAGEALVARFAGVVWSTVRSFRLSEADAHDAVQSTWLRMVENLGRLRDPQSLGGWLATTASRECLGLIRQRTRELHGHDEWLATRPDDPSRGPEQEVMDRCVADLLWQHVATLPARSQALLRLLTSGEHSYAEVSTRIGMPVGAIGPTRMRCLAQLRERVRGADLWA
jgi:RNA polymerase sigma factor (sigma-70 family)